MLNQPKTRLNTAYAGNCLSVPNAKSQIVLQFLDLFSRILQDEIQRLRSELAAERETSRKWAALHAQLLPMCERALAQPLAVPAVLSSSVLP